MIADFFTKPLQGSKFQKLSAAVMGVVSYKAFVKSETTGSKECVGTCGPTVHCAIESGSHVTQLGESAQNEKVSFNVDGDVTSGALSPGIKATYADVVKN